MTITQSINEAIGKTDYTKLAPVDEDALALELAEYFESQFSPDELLTAKARYIEDEWPKEYRNSETGKVYKPHKQEEADVCFSDVPLNIAVLGGEGCIAAETQINGIPVGDISTPSTVSTLIGAARAAVPCLKGQAHLYRILTESGREVVVTSQHRFLTPVGWRQLAFLSVGDAIAAYDASYGHLQNRIALDSQVGYSQHSRQGDELCNPVEVVVLDKLRQLHNSVFGNSALVSCLLPHSYKTHSSYHAVPIRQQIESLLHELLVFCECALTASQCYEQSPHTFHHSYISQQVYPLGDRICSGRHSEPLYQSLSISAGDKDVEFLNDSGFPLSLQSLPTAVEFLLCRIYHARHVEPHGYLPYELQPMQIFPVSWQLLSNFQFLNMLGLSLHQLSRCDYSFAPSPKDCNTFWDEIQAISFVKYGDFYDLHVPIAHHYSADGLLHHNSGKSAMGIVKDLNRLRDGMSGAMISPNFEHFLKSLWPEFRRWCPWDRVTERHQYLQELDRMPVRPFQLVFNNAVGTQSVLMCGGAYETEPAAWEGPNINFAHLDEMRRHKTPAILKVISGRVRIPGPNGEPPQLWFTTTPRYHWLFDYFGPLVCTCTECQEEYEWEIGINTVPTCPNCSALTYRTDDPFHAWKLQSAVLRLSTKDNEANLYRGFATQRALSLTAKEARVLLEAAWEDTDEDSQFLPSMELWNRLESNSIPLLSATDPLVLGVDAGKGRFNDEADCFAIVGVTRHWDPSLRRSHCAVRYCRIWTAGAGQSIDFQGTELQPGPELELRRLCKQYNVIQIAYDPYQLHDMMTRLQKEHVAWTEEVGQSKERLQADSDLLQVIIESRITHGGEIILQDHLKNADKYVDDAGSKCRIVKRHEKRKIDAAIALSMAVYRCLYLNIGQDVKKR